MGTAEKRPKVIRINWERIQVQDLLTLAGRTLLNAMFTSGAPTDNGDRLCKEGLTKLAKRAGVHKDTVVDLLVALTNFCCIQEVQSFDVETRTARTHLVRHYRNILEIWKHAGVEYYIAGRKPCFCTADGSLIHFRPTVGVDSTPTVGASPKPTVSAAPTVGVTPTWTVGSGPPATVGPEPTPTVGKNIPVATSSTSAPPGLDVKLQDILGPFTGEIPGQLWTQAREVVPDLAEDELLHVVRIMAERATRGSPTGFALTMLKPFLQGPVLKAYRKDKQEAAARDAARKAEELAFWRQTLADPAIDARTRDMACKLIAELEGQ